MEKLNIGMSREIYIYIFYFSVINKLYNNFLYISVTAEKEGFVITGPDAKGVFLAHKLAEIIVQVSDHADSSSLQVFSKIVKLTKKIHN